MTWATAPAIARPVASTTLSVRRYTPRNRMVEKKSVASLANTSFMWCSPSGIAESGLRQRRGGGPRDVPGAPVLRIPFAEVHGTVARRKGDGNPDPQGQARCIDRQDVGDQHQDQGCGPEPGDDMVGPDKAGHLPGFGV